MPLKFVKGTTLPIGLDVGTSAVKMAQMRQSDDTLELLAAGSAQLPRTGDLHQRLEQAGGAIQSILKSNDFKVRQCILSLPADCVSVQHVKTPKLPPLETGKSLRFELAGKLPFAVEDAIIRHVVAGDVFSDGDPQQEVIAVAADRGLVESYLKMADKAGLDVVGVNIEACAIVECFARLFQRSTDSARTILYVDVGAATTQVALSHGTSIVFARNLMTGGDQLDQAVAEGLSIPVTHARALRRDPDKIPKDSAAENELYRLMERGLHSLAEELTHCLHYYESVFRNQGVERAIFVGGQAYDKRLCQSLAQRLNLPAQVGDPLVRVKRVGNAGLSSGLDRRRIGRWPSD